jgi:uncharacterized protein (DUF427 family)
MKVAGAGMPEHTAPRNGGTPLNQPIDHPITISANPNRVVVTFAGKVVADSGRTLTLREVSYPPVHYIPRQDVDMPLLHRTDHVTSCPWKGEASYFSLRVGERSSENAVWTYETPFDAVSEIGSFLAFYPSRVDSIEERPAA